MAPYGYRIEGGEGVIEQKEHKQVMELFLSYIQGASIKSAAEDSGIPYSVAKRALSNPVYKGTDFYPGIVDEDLFDRAQEKRRMQNRSRAGSAREAGRRSGSNRSGSNRSGSNRSGSNRSGSNRSGSNKSGSNGSGGSGSGSSRSGGGRSGSSRSGRQNQPVRIRNRFRISPRLLSAGIPSSEEPSSWIYRHIRVGREKIISDSMREAVFALYKSR